MDKYAIAKALFSTSSAQEPDTATVLYGTAAGDSAGGRVSVLLNGVTYASDDDGSAIDMDTTTDVRAGDTVIVTVSDGHPVVTGVVGSGDRTRADVEAAEDAASAAQGTANDAKSTADSLATLIRADSTGVTVGKSADGKTYSTGRTRMTDSAFQVLDKAGKVITQLAADGASFLSGLVRIVAGKATLPGNKTVNSIVIDAGDGVAALHGTISRLDATINSIKSSVSAGWEQDFGSGVVLVSRNTSTNEASAFAVYPYGVRVNGLSVSQAAHKSTYSSNLNDVDYGVNTFTPATTGRPTDGYGYCVTVSAGNGGTHSYWRHQVAIVNGSGIYTRECVNPGSGASWTSWRRMTYYDRAVTPIYRLRNPYSGVYLYTSSSSEYNSLISAGWSGEGTNFYAFN